MGLFGCGKPVNTQAESLPDYASTHKKRCPKCGYEWIYRGKGIGIRCQKCGQIAMSKAYLKAYKQKPESKAYMKAYLKAYKQKPEYKAYRKAYYERKKAERLVLVK